MGELLWLETCGSTNDEARAWWDALTEPVGRQPGGGPVGRQPGGGPVGRQPGGVTIDAVATDHQTGGRGRRGRAWFSPPGCGVYLSVIVRDTVRPAHAAVLPLLAGIVTAEFCISQGAVPVLKWPNDVLTTTPDGRKLAGILCESRVEGDRLTAVVGIGLNLRTPPGGYPRELNAAALETALAPQSAARTLWRTFEGALATLSSGDPFTEIVPAWMRLGPPLGVRIRSGDRVGAYAGLARDGALMLDTPDGPLRVDAGEVEMVGAF